MQLGSVRGLCLCKLLTAAHYPASPTQQGHVLPSTKALSHNYHTSPLGPVSSSTSLCCALAIPFPTFLTSASPCTETAVCHIVRIYFLPKQLCMQILLAMSHWSGPGFLFLKHHKYRTAVEIDPQDQGDIALGRASVGKGPCKLLAAAHLPTPRLTGLNICACGLQVTPLPSTLHLLGESIMGCSHGDSMLGTGWRGLGQPHSILTCFYGSSRPMLISLLRCPQPRG